MEQKSFCVYGCPEHPASEYEAKRLIQHLMDDLKSTEPRVKWQFDAEHHTNAMFSSRNVLIDGDTVEIYSCGTRKHPGLLLNYIRHSRDFFTAVEYGVTGQLASFVTLVTTIAHAASAV
jgi:hypothetical protein